MDNAADSIKERVPNRYSLVVLAAKRAKQLKEGAPFLITTENTNLLTVALEEIAAGKIHYFDAVEPEDDEAPAQPVQEAAPAPKPASEAMRMLTESLDEAERASQPDHDDAEAHDNDVVVDDVQLADAGVEEE